jgi:hypothetical protein
LEKAPELRWYDRPQPDRLKKNRENPAHTVFKKITIAWQTICGAPPFFRQIIFLPEKKFE